MLCFSSVFLDKTYVGKAQILFILLCLHNWVHCCTQSVRNTHPRKSPNLPYSEGIGSPAAEIPLLKVGLPLRTSPYLWYLILVANLHSAFPQFGLVEPSYG